MSGCEPTDDVKRIIRAMAKAKVEEGFTNHEDILDEIHSAIKDHTPLWKNEIADIISGYGQKASRKATKTELEARMEQLRRDLKAAYHPKQPPKTPEQRQNARRQTELKKQIADIQDQIARKDFSKPEKAAPVYDAETKKLEAQLASSKRQADQLLHKLNYENKSRAAKIADTALAFHRAAILSGIGTIEHLSGAVLWRVLGTPLEQAAGAILHQIPGIRQISENAPTEGGGFQGGAQLAGLKHAFGPGTLRDIRDKLLRGYSDLQAVGKAPLDSNHPLLELVGHLHDAIKTPAERFGYARALDTFYRQTRKQLARDGMSPDEIDKAMVDPAMEARGQALAYGESQRAKLQGDNAFVNVLRSTVRQIGTHGVGGKAFEHAFNYQVPILKIPTNLFAEASSYAAGEVKALGSWMNHEKGKFTPEVNDYIMRNLKKGLVGKALAVVAWILYKQFGALYDDERRKKAGEPDYGDVRTPAGTIKKGFLHSPAWDFMQAVALAHRVYDQELARKPKEGESRKSPAEAAFTGGLHGGRAMIDALPFVDQPKRFYESLKNSQGMGDYAGQAVAANIPQAIKDVAKMTDDEALKRKPKGFSQQIEVAIPGLRNNVPLQDIKHMSMDAKLDAYEKMTPAQRDKSGIVDAIYRQAQHSRSLTDDQRRRIEAIP